MKYSTLSRRSFLATSVAGIATLASPLSGAIARDTSALVLISESPVESSFLRGVGSVGSFRAIRAPTLSEAEEFLDLLPRGSAIRVLGLVHPASGVLLDSLVQDRRGQIAHSVHHDSVTTEWASILGATLADKGCSGQEIPGQFAHRIPPVHPGSGPLVSFLYYLPEKS